MQSAPRIKVLLQVYLPSVIPNGCRWSPARWDHPDLFDIHRPKLTNMAFGLGTHRCLGMNVAKVEMARGINALLDAFPDMRFDPDAPTPFMTGGLEQRGPSALPVLLR